MLYNVKVSDEAFEHLKPQRGALWDMRDERGNWVLSYKQALRATFGVMLPYLPELPARPVVLDIGAGMGGIDLLIWRRYGAGTKLHLIDRIGGAPACDAHGQPFGDLGVSRRFLEANGVAPEDISLRSHVGIDDCAPWGEPAIDVVISTRAWCFHFAPQPYLDWLASRLKRGAVVITDMRHGQDAWLADMIGAFGEPVDIAKRERKSDLLVFRQ